MNQKLVVIFFKKARASGKISLNFLKEKMMFTPGEIFDFLLDLTKNSIATLSGDEIVIRAEEKKILEYKKHALVPLKEFEEAFLIDMSEKFNDNMLRIIDCIHLNPSITHEEILEKEPTLQAGSVKIDIGILKKYGLICAVESELFTYFDDKTYSFFLSLLKKKGLDVEIIRSYSNGEVFDVKFVFQDPLNDDVFEYSAQVLKATTPISALNTAYVKCQNEDIKIKMRRLGLQYLTYSTVLDLQNSSFILEDDEPFQLDFNLPFIKQLESRFERGANEVFSFKVKLTLKTIE